MTLRLRILIILPDLRLGGGQRVLIELARHFALLGHEVNILSLVADGELLSTIPPEVNYSALIKRLTPNRYWLIVKVFIALVLFLKKNKADIVLSSMTGTNLVTAAAFKVAGCRQRLVLREAASLVNAGNHLIRKMMAILYRHADAVVAVSAGVANDLLTLNLDPKKIHIIHNPVNPERLRTMALAARSDIEKPYIVSLGRLVDQKDHATLLRAYAFSEARKFYRMVIVGEGDRRDDLLSLIKDLEIQDRTELVGALANPYGVLSGASLHVLSSRWEGYPNVLLEALALGVPVAATDCPAGPRELLDGGRYGGLAPVGDHFALARAIDFELSREPVDVSDLMVAHGIQFIAARYLAISYSAS